MPCIHGRHNTTSGLRYHIRVEFEPELRLCYDTVNGPAQVYFRGADERIDPLRMGLLQSQCYLIFPFL